MGTAVQLELWQLITLLLAFFACVGAFGKMIMSQLDKRFTAQEKARAEGSQVLRDSIAEYAAKAERTATQLSQLERDFLNWKSEIPVQYVRREDYVRGQTVLEAKLDAIASELKLVQLQGVQKHG